VPLEAVSVGGLFCFDGETAESQRRYQPNSDAVGGKWQDRRKNEFAIPVLNTYLY
jgi:hypothetical protein